MKKKPCCLGYTGDHTPQLNGDSDYFKNHLRIPIKQTAFQWKVSEVYFFLFSIDTVEMVQKMMLGGS